MVSENSQDLNKQFHTGQKLFRKILYSWLILYSCSACNNNSYNIFVNKHLPFVIGEKKITNLKSDLTFN